MHKLTAASCLVVMLALAGCGGGSAADGAAGSAASKAPTAAAANLPPTISGLPGTALVATYAYQFTPSASDPDGDALTFSIRNKPAWASFSASTGQLSGVPAATNAGAFPGITISVSDGKTSTALASFSITVTTPSAGAAPTAGTGSVSLSWMPPTQNADGSALTDLAGYRIVYGNSSNLLDRSIDLKNPGLTRYVITNLSAGTYYFALRSYNAAGAESELTGIASKTIT
jgi:hypothetical protein